MWGSLVFLGLMKAWKEGSCSNQSRSSLAKEGPLAEVKKDKQGPREMPGQGWVG